MKPSKRFLIISNALYNGFCKGICITVSLKIALVKLAQSRTFRGFYRTSPLLSNIFAIALECWHLALASAAAISRLAKLIILSILFMGRIDYQIVREDLGKSLVIWSSSLLISSLELTLICHRVNFSVDCKPLLTFTLFVSSRQS